MKDNANWWNILDVQDLLTDGELYLVHGVKRGIGEDSDSAMSWVCTYNSADKTFENAYNPWDTSKANDFIVDDVEWLMPLPIFEDDSVKSTPHELTYSIARLAMILMNTATGDEYIDGAKCLRRLQDHIKATSEASNED